MEGRTVGAGRGSVYAGGKVYLEGATIPSDVEVDDYVFTDADDDSAGQPVVNQVVVDANSDGGGDGDAAPAKKSAPAKKAAPAKKSTGRSRSRSRSRS